MADDQRVSDLVAPDDALMGLARNWRDSLAHALSHFSELRAQDCGFHNRKWIILSVHHAAEVFCNFLLKRADPSFQPKRYPSLPDAVRELRRRDVWATLRPTERQIIERYLPPLQESRNRLMHRPAPEKIDVSGVALAMLALLILVKKQTGLSTHEFLDQSPPIEMSVVDELRVRQLRHYTEFVEHVVREEIGSDVEEQPWLIRQCENCGGMTRVEYERECRACFDESTLDDDVE